MSQSSRLLRVVPLLLETAAACSSDLTAPAQPGDITRINHVVVLYLENRSFDNLYGEFAGAEGLSAATRYTQMDSAGVAYSVLPQAANGGLPATLPNSPFAIEWYIPAGTVTRDLVHRYYQEQQQIDGGMTTQFDFAQVAK